jgi:hypothetical protein
LDRPPKMLRMPAPTSLNALIPSTPLGDEHRRPPTFQVSTGSCRGRMGRG